MEFKAEGMPVNIVLGDPDVNWMMQVSQELSINPKIRVVGFASMGQMLIDRASMMAADAVLVNYSMPDMTAIEIVQKLADASPGTAVFVMAPTMSTQIVMTAKSAGIVEVFDRANYSPAEVARRIVEHVDSLRREWAEVARKHGVVEKGTGPMGITRKETETIVRPITQSIIFTHSPKGGVGKSTIAANLAAAIKNSPVLSGAKVALLDFDCEFGNLSTLFALPPNMVLTRNISQWANVPENISAAEVDELLVPTPSGLMVLPAPINPAIAAKVTYETGDKVLKILKRYYSIIVIDGGPKIPAIVDAALQHATHVLLISTPEGQAAENLNRVVSFLRPDPNYPNKDFSYLLSKMFLVINRVKKSRGELTPAQVAEIVGVPVIAEIPEDEVVPLALHEGNGKQAVEYKPDAPFSIAIKQLANEITGAYPMVTAQAQKNRAVVEEFAPQKKKRRLFGFLPF